MIAKGDISSFTTTARRTRGVVARRFELLLAGLLLSRP